MSLYTELRDALAAVWEQRMHDGNGARVATVFLHTVREAHTAGTSFPSREVPERVLDKVFAPVEDDPTAGLLWGFALTAVTDMAAEAVRILAARKRGVGGDAA
ncbi:hypothetical protein [Nocardia paucivorans]|uniref:hypothetical protein n=1 Tax=Nocardia paucivorans TaxID=114259 RepID=UPI0002FD8B4C|nr:hypothetical protein [Nocardia paucivorans]